MGSLDTTILSTALGAVIGGTSGCIFSCCNPCFAVVGLMGGATVGFAIPVIAYTTAAVANTIFSSIAFVLTSSAQLLSFSGQQIAIAGIQHPYIAIAISLLTIAYFYNRPSFLSSPSSPS